MTIEGRIAVDIGFTDTHTAGSVQNAQRISFVSTDSYTAGKVAVYSGTAGTAAIFLDTAPTTFRDASGAIVSFSAAERVVVHATQPCEVGDGGNSLVGQTFCMFGIAGQPQIELHKQGTSGTMAYTAIFYGT